MAYIKRSSKGLAKRAEGQARLGPPGVLEREHIHLEQEARFEADAWEEVISPWLDGKDRFTIYQVAFNFDKSKIGTPDQSRIAAILERLGWKRDRDWKAGVTSDHDAHDALSNRLPYARARLPLKQIASWCDMRHAIWNAPARGCGASCTS